MKIVELYLTLPNVDLSEAGSASGVSYQYERTGLLGGGKNYSNYMRNDKLNLPST